MKNKTTIQQARALLEKYYEGLTSAAEEEQLRVFLQQKNLPEEFAADRDILGYFARGKKQAGRRRLYLYGRRAAIAAAMLAGGLLLVQPLLHTQQDSYAYINGKRITNMEVIEREALISLGKICQTNEKDIISYQLSIFNQEEY